MKYLRLYVLLGSLCCFGLGCDSSQDQAQSPPDTAEEPAASANSSASAQAEEARQAIEQQLKAYYEALEAERLEEAQFFAPQVQRFYAQENLSRETVANSIRTTFDKVEDRSISLDVSSLNVQQTPSGNYVAEFSGDVAFIRVPEGTQVQEKFRNRVIFNEDFQIVAYESLEAQQQAQSRSAGARQDAARSLQGLLQALRSGSGIAEFIHPTHGFYFRMRPGAMDMVYAYSRLEEVYENPLSPSMKETLGQLTCNDLKREALPEYDCNSFSKTGCFMAEVEAPPGISKLMQYLNQVESNIFSDQDVEKAQRAEAFIGRKVVITDASLALYLGEIQGAWYLLLIDVASYDCSA